MLSGGRGRETPLGGSAFAVWQTPSRPVKNGRHLRRIGVRLGPLAKDDWSNSIQTPPLALRRVGVRELLDALSVPEQVGYPASMNADAC